MFAGKTEALIGRLNEASKRRARVQIFKPLLDNRYAEEVIMSHNAKSLPALPVRKAKDILSKINNCDIVGIDEVQFFDDRLINGVNILANPGKRVILSGLDMDYLGKPFDLVARIMSIAEYVTKLQGICAQCGVAAFFSHRLLKAKRKILLGERKEYEV
jgi:thymidine kinase